MARRAEGPGRGRRCAIVGYTVLVPAEGRGIIGADDAADAGPMYSEPGRDDDSAIDERAGVVVAERIKRDLRDPAIGVPSPLALTASVSTSTEGLHAPGPAEAGRIPDEKEKAGPDKV